jgi:predicted Zn-dependent protease
MANNPRVAAYEASKKPVSKPTPKPAPKKTPVIKTGPTGAEKLLQKYLREGMSLDKARKKVSNETGIWPNGYTN